MHVHLQRHSHLPLCGAQMPSRRGQIPLHFGYRVIVQPEYIARIKFSASEPVEEDNHNIFDKALLGKWNSRTRADADSDTDSDSDTAKHGKGRHFVKC